MVIKKRILVGITGSIAAYKVAELVRLLVLDEFDVQVVMTESAQRFITATTLQALSRNPVPTSMWVADDEDGMQHIHLSRQVDAIVLAPASADFIAKLASGRADDLLSAICLARNCPLFVVPAMNTEMWHKPAVQRNLLQIKQDGAVVLGPDMGQQACGETGLGRMLAVEEIQQALYASFQPKLLQNQRVMITAGATLEMLDPVRGITNISSGQMGRAMTQIAWEMGADVTLIKGITQVEFPVQVACIAVRSAHDMRQAVMDNIQTQDIFVSVAAVSDYRPQQLMQQKMRKSQQGMTLSLLANPDILYEVAHLPNPPFCVGFAAETEDILVSAQQKRLHKKLALIVANDARLTLGEKTVSAVLIDAQGVRTLPKLPKLDAARDIWAHIATMLNARA